MADDSGNFERHPRTEPARKQRCEGSGAEPRSGVRSNEMFEGALRRETFVHQLAHTFAWREAPCELLSSHPNDGI